MPQNDGWAALDRTIDAYLEERRTLFMRGFAEYCIKQGLDKPSPYPPSREKKHTWRERGQRMYGARHFDACVKELLDAKKRVPAVRGHQGQVPGGGQTPGRGEDSRSSYHQLEEWSRSTEPPEESPQAGLDFRY